MHELALRTHHRIWPYVWYIEHQFHTIYIVSGHKVKSSNEGLRTSLKTSTRNCMTCTKYVYKHSYTM